MEFIFIGAGFAVLIVQVHEWILDIQYWIRHRNDPPPLFGYCKLFEENICYIAEREYKEIVEL